MIVYNVDVLAVLRDLTIWKWRQEVIYANRLRPLSKIPVAVRKIQTSVFLRHCPHEWTLPPFTAIVVFYSQTLLVCWTLNELLAVSVNEMTDEWKCFEQTLCYVCRNVHCFQQIVCVSQIFLCPIKSTPTFQNGNVSTFDWIVVPFEEHIARRFQ